MKCNIILRAIMSEYITTRGIHLDYENERLEVLFELEEGRGRLLIAPEYGKVALVIMTNEDSTESFTLPTSQNIETVCKLIKTIDRLDSYSAVKDRFKSTIIPDTEYYLGLWNGGIK